MTLRGFKFIGGIAFLIFCVPFYTPSDVLSQSDDRKGIQPLFALNGRALHELISPSAQPLIFVSEIQQFLETLETEPPVWSQLHHSDIREQSERLFQFNRQRDSARATKKSLEQPIAFLWTGILRQYLPEFKGFSLALGPEYTKTTWGIVRFKPVDLPDYLVAVPSLELGKHLIKRQKGGEQIEVLVICIGTLISDESIIYGFSHDDGHSGMILPVVSVQTMMYILNPS